MKCPACGADNREGARFCRGCGLRLLEDEARPKIETENLPVEGTLGEAEPEDREAEEAMHGKAASEEGTETEVVELPAEDSEPEAQAGDEAGVAAITEAGPEEFDTQPERAGIAPDSIVVQTEEQTTADAEADSEEKPSTHTLVESSEGQDLAPPKPLGEDEIAKETESEPVFEAMDDVFAFWREEGELMTPVAPDTVIEGRFVVVEALDVQERDIFYLAHDLKRCWQCGYDENDPEGAFCARCGVLMDHRPEVRLLEVRDAEAEPDTELVIVDRLSHESRHFLLLAEPEPEPEGEADVPSEPQSYRLLVGQRSDAGQVRELDEDSLFVLTLAPTYESRMGPVLGLFAVADGMGGHSSGEVASKMALQTVAERVMRTVVLPEIAGELVWEDDILALLRQATIAANDAVYLARQKRENDMGTTLTAALIRDDRLFLAHVGDCRAYRFSANGLEQLTTDHAVVARMIADGQAEPEELYTHPHRSIIYRCIGDKPVVEVDTDLLPLTPGDRIILCCDGLWEMIRDEGIKDVLMQEADPQRACDLLVRHANAAGGDDNISVIVIQVETVTEAED